MSRTAGWLVAFLLIWFPFACAVTLAAGMGYVMVQQDLRLSGNDPQIQLAEDTAAALGSGKAAGTLVTGPPVDLARSLAPFQMVFDEQGRLVAGTAQLAGAPPTLPPGLLDAARAQEDRVSWQPAPGVRYAAVIVHVSGGPGGFVLAGRSLREVEARIDVVGQLALVGWLLGLGSTALGSGALAWASGRRRPIDDGRETMA